MKRFLLNFTILFYTRNKHQEDSFNTIYLNYFQHYFHLMNDNTFPFKRTIFFCRKGLVHILISTEIKHFKFCTIKSISLLGTTESFFNENIFAVLQVLLAIGFFFNILHR